MKKSGSSREIVQRVITGLLGAFVIIGSLLWSSYGYFAIFFTLCIVSLLEFYKLLRMAGYRSLPIYGVLSGVLIFAVSFFVSKGLIADSWYYLMFPWFMLLFVVQLYRPADPNPFLSAAFTFLGILYVAVPLSAFNFYLFEQGSYSPGILIGVLFILWSSDSGAFFAGSTLGKTPLFKRVSPNKSWEGLAGGAVLALIATWVFIQIYSDIPWMIWLAIGLITIVAGVIGDLVESLLKRSLKIKDSGSILPGHGGFLDRFDGLLLSAPFIIAFLKIFH